MSDPKKFWKFMLVLGFTAMRLPLILLFLGICIVAPAPLSSLWFSLALGAIDRKSTRLNSSHMSWRPPPTCWTDCWHDAFTWRAGSVPTPTPWSISFST